MDLHKIYNDIKKVLDKNGIEANELMSASINHAAFRVLTAKNPMLSGVNFKESKNDPFVGWIDIKATTDDDGLIMKKDSVVDFFKDSSVDRNNYVIKNDRKNDMFTNTILDGLRKESPAYEKLLSEKPISDPIQYAIIPKSKNAIEQVMQYGLDPSKQYFQYILEHNQFAIEKAHSFVIASNSLGVVGIMGLKYEGDKLKIIDTSVTPSFRKQGIASKMTDEAIKYAYNKGKLLSSEPTDKNSREFFFQMVKKKSEESKYRVPFIEPAMDQIAEIISKTPAWNQLNQDQKYKAMGQIMNAIKHFAGNDYDMSSRYAVSNMKGIDNVLKEIVPQKIKDVIEDNKLQNTQVKHSYAMNTNYKKPKMFSDDA